MLKKIVKKIGTKVKDGTFPYQNTLKDNSISRKVSQLALENKPRELSDIERNNNFFFVHIPKTAGTSFRYALEDKYVVLRDYGAKSEQTSKIIKKYICDEDSPLALRNELKKMKNIWLTGHVSLSKYSDMVSVRHIIAFVRDPIQQVISHYNHYVAYHGFEGDINQFFKKGITKNFQRRNLAPLPMGLIGYIGLTDKYDESIQVINNYYGLSLRAKTANVNTHKTITDDSVSEELKAKIIKLNPQDINCVKEARFLHDQRVELIKQNKEWVYSHFAINPNNVLVGCAYYSHSSKPVEFDLFCNDKLVTSSAAKTFFNGFPKVNFPRERYIGVHLPLSALFKVGDVINIYAQETGQKLTFKALIVKGTE